MKRPLHQMLLCVLLSLLAAVRSEFLHHDVIADATLRYVRGLDEESVFKAQLRELQVVRLEDNSTKLRFPIRETVCQSLENQQEELCPLKKNGKFTMCSLEILDLVLDGKPNLACEPMKTSDQQQVQSRVKRGTSRRRFWISRGSRRGGSGRRSGYSASIASVKNIKREGIQTV